MFICSFLFVLAFFRGFGLAFLLVFRLVFWGGLGLVFGVAHRLKTLIGWGYKKEKKKSGKQGREKGTGRKG